MIRFSNYERVNSGALVAVRRKGKTLYLTVVEASAALTCEPYRMANEAPRIYDDFGSEDVKSAWVHWVAELIDPEGLFGTDKQAREFIEANLGEIPEASSAV